MLSPGARLGPYEVIAPLGAGGMGEVYRGRDPRLGRDVALKILPSMFADDPDRLRRFEQEARAAAALNHPNILGVHDVGTHDGSPYIVAELLDGEPLRACMQAPLSVRRTVGYALQIAHGLAAAHERGIVHRDLKPENILLTSDGLVKILDFGLAKLVQHEGAAGSGSAPTVADGTRAGFVMGTADYMSPEQVRGDAVDHRSDIFSFGVVLYEMLAGHRPFAGNSAPERMSAILRDDPPDLEKTRVAVPPALARIVERCLQKAPSARFQSTRDLAFALEQSSMASGQSAAPTVAIRSPHWLPWALFGFAAAACLAVSLAWWLAAEPPPHISAPLRFQLPVPGSYSYTGSGNFIAVSPDGRRIAYAATKDGTPVLWVQAFDSLSARALPETDRATAPFWSPDGRYVGFFADGKLKKVDADGGPALELCQTPPFIATGATWSRSGVILFAHLYGPIYQVAENGGAPQAVTRISEPARDMHLYPQFLPDGVRFLFFLQAEESARSGIYLGALDSDEIRRVAEAESRFAYVDPGYLVYARAGLLMAQPFDWRTGSAAGEPLATPERVEQLPHTGNVAFSLSPSGVLAYRASAQAALSRLLWFSRDGTPLGALGEPATYRNPRLSPDDRQIAVEIADGSGNRDIWLMDARNGTLRRLTSDSGRDAAPVWSRDGRRIAWQAHADTRIRVLSTGRDEIAFAEPWIPDDWRGESLLFHPPQPREIARLELSGTERRARTVIQGSSIITQARVSPDGKWIAFATSDSGRFEIDVQSYAGGPFRTRVSTAGGIQPKWRHDGMELFYLAPDGTLMSVEVTSGEAIQIGQPRPLFSTGAETTTGQYWHQYDVTRDGRILVTVPLTPTPLIVVVNWPTLLQQR